MDFEVVGQIQNIEPIAVGRGIHDRSRLNKLYGKGRWRKLKGFGGSLVRSPRHRSARAQAEIASARLTMTKKSTRLSAKPLAVSQHVRAGANIGDRKSVV